MAQLERIVAEPLAMLVAECLALLVAWQALEERRHHAQRLGLESNQQIPRQQLLVRFEDATNQAAKMAKRLAVLALVELVPAGQAPLF